MKRALVLALVPAVALTSCMRHQRARTSTGAPMPVARLAPATAAPPAPGVAAPPGAPGAPVPAAPGGGDLLSEGRKAAAIDEQQRKVLLDSALASARAALQNADVDGARTFYGRALEIDPQNAEAREGWKNLNADRPSSVSDYFERTRREEVIRRDEAAAQVAAHMNRGRTLEGQEDFQGAIKEYSAALAIVSWYTDQTAFGVTSDSLKNLIDDVRVKADAKQRDERAQAVRKAQAERERDLAREREERLGRIKAFFKEADLAYRRQEYATAREYARAVLREDPQNQCAKNLIEISIDAEHSAAQDYNRKTFDEEWKRVFEDFELAILPQVKVVEFPDNWLSEVAQRTPRSVGDADQPADTESKAAIMATLEAKRVKGLQFTDQNLDQVVTYLRTVTGLNFHITPKVRSGKFDEIKVNIPGLDDVSVREVLDLVTQPYDLRWEPRNGVVTIAMKDEVAGQLRLKYFDVHDLAVKIQNFRGTDIYLAPSNYTPPEPPELPEAAPIYPTDALVDTIKQIVDPDSWQTEGASLDIKNGTLIARNTVETLDKIEQLLGELRRHSGPMVSLEVRFITVEDNFLRDVGVDVRGLGDNSQGLGVPGLGTSAPQDDIFYGTAANPQGVPFGVKPEPPSSGTGNDSGIFYNDGQDGAYQARIENLFDSVLGNPATLLGTGGLSFQHTFLDDTQLEVILRAVEKSERLQTITASKLTVYNTQRATVEVLNKVAYVADYDVEIAQAANIANPVIKNAIDGVVLDVKPVVSADRRFITLELRPTVATLSRPIPTFATSLASNMSSAPVVIQIPHLQKSSVRTTVTMPDGGTLLLGGLKFYEQVDATSEVPVLGQVPVLGFLFSRKGSFINRRNLIVLITATVQALEEQEPKGEYRPPPVPESFVPVTTLPEEDTVDAVSPCAPPPPKCPPSPCAPR